LIAKNNKIVPSPGLTQTI